jgi:hypothetical protein
VVGIWEHVREELSELEEIALEELRKPLRDDWQADEDVQTAH